MERPWAFWRRVQYITGLLVFILIVWTGSYYLFFHEAAGCFDGVQNGEERGIDCGGACVRVCSFDVLPPTALWARSFKITDGQYNAVTYIENRNLSVGSPEVQYTFSLYDENGLITERSGTTVLPPDSTYPIFEGRIDTGSRIPTQTFIELEDPEIWLPAESGREQFIVESRELRNVDTLPRLNAELTNTSITEAKDVEIVTTIFDTQGNALTSSRTVVPEFSGRTTQEIVFTWPLPIAKTLRSCEVPTDVVLAIDLSGSMNDDGGNPPEPVTSVLQAAESFVNRLKDHDQISIVTYATKAVLAQTLSGDTDSAAILVSKLSINPADERGSTNTGDAIKLVEQELLSTRHSANARKVMVLLTDGLANAPKGDPEQYALDAAAALRASDVEIFSIGLGENVNEEFLKDMASDQQHYYIAPSASTVDQIYRSITAAICEDGPAVIDIVPKTGTSFPPLK